MKIQYKFGNLLEHPGKFLAHCVNQQGVMGSGVAKTIRYHFPKCYDVYKNTHETTGLHMGQVVVADCDRFVFFNCVAQEFYGKDGKVYVDYDAMRAALRSCNRLLVESNITSSDFTILELAMPLMGAGLAGGDWSMIAKIIEEESTEFQPVVYVIDSTQYKNLISINKT